MINNLNQTSFTQQWVLVMIMTKSSFIYPKIISLIIFIIVVIQPLFMVIENGIQSPESWPNLPHLFILLIFRQDLLLLHYSINHSTLFIVVLSIMTAGKTLQYLMTFLLSRIKDMEQQFQKIDECSSFRFSLQVLSFYLQLQITLLHLPFSTLCMISFSSSLDHINQGDNQYITHFLLATLTYILLQVDYLITFSIISTPLTYKFNHLDVQHISVISYLDYLLMQIQVIFFCILKDQIILRYAEQIFLIISLFSKLINQVLYQTYLFREQRYILMHLISLQFVIGVHYFSYQFNALFTGYFIIPLLVYPIILHWLLKIDELVHNRLFFNIFKDENSIDVSKLIVQLKLILNQCDTINSMIPFKSSLINKFHRLQCPDETCICSNKLFVSEISQANAITQSILKQFIHEKILYITNQFDKQTYKLSQLNYQELILIKTRLLHDFGWWTESMQNLSTLINCHLHNLNFVVRAIQQRKQINEDSQIESSTKKDKSEEQQSFLRIKIGLNIIEFNKITFLLYLTKAKLKQYLGNSMQAHQQMVTTDFISQFLQYDQCLREIQNKTVEIINNKINFYHKVIEDEKHDPNKLGNLTMDICLQLSTLNRSLKTTYKKYPCISVQRCLCFFQCELLNNYYEANKTTSFTSMQIEKLFRSKKITNYDIQVDNTAYAVLSIKGELDDFQIEYTSPQFLKIIGKSKTQSLTFSDLLPKFMKTWHPLFISKFFIDGQSRYYKSFNQSFISTHLGLLKTVYLCYDLTKVFINQNLVFAGFIQELPDQKCFILCHGMNMRLSISENFFKKIGFDQRLIFGLPEAQAILTGLYLSYLLPDITQLQQESEGDTFQLNTDLRFLDDAFLRNCSADSKDLGSIILDQKQWQKDDQVNFYQVGIIVTKRHLSNQSYILIEFSSIIKYLKKARDAISQPGQVLNEREIQSNYADIDYINDSFASLMNLSGEAEPKKINIFDVRMKEFLHNELGQLEEEVPNIVSFRKDEICMNIPPQSRRELLSERKKDIQQEFYNKQLFQMESLQQSSIEQVQSPTKKKKHQHNPADDIQSQQSSVGGVKESQLFKKFEMIEKIIKNKKFDKMIIYLSLVILQIAFFISFNIIVVTFISSELLQFISEIDMISLHANIMAPHDMYLSIKVTISAYQQQYREHYIDNSTLQRLIDPLYQFNAPYYFDLQSSLYQVVQNDHLQHFFIDKNETVFFMGDNDSITYSKELSFREELLALLHAQYQFKRVFDTRKNANGQACQVMQFANYFNLQDKLEELTDEILNYSKNRSLDAITKWFIVWLIFQIISIFFGIGALFVKRKILKTYEKILTLFYFSDKSSLESEIHKLKYLNSQIQQNSDSLTKYDFNFKEREDLVNQKKKDKALTKIDKPKVIGLQKLGKLKPLIAFLSMYIYFCVYSLIINQQTKTYLTKYGQTTDFYRLIQDLRFRSGNIYVYREIFFRWSNFTYLNQTDLDRLYGLVAKSQNVIKIYLNDLSNLQNDQYLFSDNYISFIDQVQNNDLCNYLEAKYSNLSQYCPVALDGVLLKGMVPSLNYISQAIQSQQEINNFTKRVEVHFYELEGAQIICQAFFDISQHLKQGMIDLTNNFNQTNEILTYLFLLSQLLFSIIYLTCFRKSLIHEFTMYKKSLYLIPIQVLLGDNSLERALRQFEFTEKI